MADRVAGPPDSGASKPKASRWRMLRNVGLLVAVAGLFVLLYFVSPGFNYWVRYVIDILSHGDLERLKWYLRSFGIWAP